MKVIALLFAFWELTSVGFATASPANINTVAGTGASGSTGVGGPATAATFYVLRSVWEDTMGVIYVSAQGDRCVRKFSSVGTNTLFLVAGQCGSGDAYAGDGGPATSASLGLPVGLTGDTMGGVYIGEYANSVVRAVSATGIISTFAGNGSPTGTGDGGKATAATFNEVAGVWLNSAGVLFVVVDGSYAVRSISTAGIITLFAGSYSPGSSGDGGPATSAKIFRAQRVGGDTSGEMYIADTYNYRVRSVSTSGIISLYGGTGSPTYSGENAAFTSMSLGFAEDVAVDRNTGDVYVSSYLNRVFVNTLATGVGTTYAGNGSPGSTGDGGAATAASLNVCDGIFLNTQGMMYIAENGGSKVRVVYSVAPTVIPTTSPTMLPSIAPTVAPSTTPSVIPSIVPTVTPSTSPTLPPTLIPTVVPSVHPSTAPTTAPTTPPSVLPSISPSTAPVTMTPTVAPSHPPTVVPSILPTLLPSTVPSVRPTMVPSLSSLPIRSSPSYKVTNQLAFVGLTTSGNVMTWGSAASGGDSSSVSYLLVNVKEVVSSKNAFAARKSDGSVVAWGEASAVSGGSVYRSATNIMSIAATERAFAGVTSDGGVIAFGAGCCGGNVDEYGSWSSSYLSSGVETVVGNAGAFCALKSEGTVYCWGSEFAGGGVSSVSRSDLTGIVLLVSTRSAFAGMKSDGSVVSWGNKYFGGVMPAYVSSVLSQHTLHIVSRETAFVAYTDTSMLHSWSAADSGGGADLSEPGGVKYVAHTSKAFAAVRTNGSLVCWGDRLYGGDCSAATWNVSSVVGTRGAFAALTSDGEVMSWGSTEYGGSSVTVSGAVSLHHTSRAFAALKSDGLVVTWGASHYGGSVDGNTASYLSSGVRMICSNDVAFTAFLRDGSAVLWGRYSGQVLTGNYSSVVDCKCLLLSA